MKASHWTTRASPTSKAKIGLPPMGAAALAASEGEQYGNGNQYREYQHRVTTCSIHGDMSLRAMSAVYRQRREAGVYLMEKG